MTEKQKPEKSADSSVTAKLQRFLFGDDVFISYSRRRGGEYALALANELTQKKLSCYLDLWGTPPGKELPESLKRSLRGSSMLVLVGTKWAAASVNVRKEVEEFLKTGRSVVPITFVEEEVYSKIQNGTLEGEVGGTLREAEWYSLIEGVAQSVESVEALTTNRPSANIVSRIVNAEGFTQRSRRLRNAFWIVLISTLLLVGAGAWAVKMARDGVTAADLRQRGSEKKAQQAEERTEKADHSLALAQGRLTDASSKLVQAAAELKSVDHKREQAQAEATRQQEIALIRRLANRSDFALGQGLDSLMLGVSLAIEAAQRDDALHQHSLEVDAVLRKSLALLPRPLLIETLPKSIGVAALSPDARHIATFEEREQTLKIRGVAGGEGVLGALHFRSMGRVALNNDARRWAQEDSEKQVVHVREVFGDSSWDIDVQGLHVSEVALSPNGSYLAVGFWNDHDRLRVQGGDMYKGYLGVWEVGSRS